MPDTYRTYVRYTPNGLRVTEDEFDRFSEAAYEIEQLLPEVLECHVAADLEEQCIELEVVLVAGSENEATIIIESLSDAVAHQVDVLAGRATTHGSTTRTERLTPA